MESPDAAPTPLYQQVMEDLRDDIDRGRYVHGDRIPSEIELARRYSVSRITIRHAVEELVAQGYLTKRQGKGTFVSRGRLSKKLVQHGPLVSFVRVCDGEGRSSGMRLLGIGMISADPDICAFLDVRDLKTLRLQRVLMADGVPVMVEENFFSPARFGFLLEMDLEGASLAKTIEHRSGKWPALIDSRSIEMVPATRDHARALDVPLSEPLLFETAMINDQDGSAFCARKRYIVGGLWVFSSR